MGRQQPPIPACMTSLTAPHRQARHGRARGPSPEEKEGRRTLAVVTTAGPCPGREGGALAVWSPLERRSVYGRRTPAESPGASCPPIRARRVALPAVGLRGDSAPPLADVLGRLGAADRLPTVRPVVSVVALSLHASGGRYQRRAAVGLRLTPH